MPDIDKNIIITPNRGSTLQPNIVFTGQGVDPITLRVLDGATGTGITAGGAISFEGSAGQLFSVVNRLGTGSIFSVNDISGIPSLDIDASGRIHMASFTGFVGIGLTAPSEKLNVSGNVLASGRISAVGGLSASGGIGVTGGATFNGNVNIVGSVSAVGGQFTALTTFSSGISASGGVTFNSTIISNGYRYSSSIFDSRTSGFTLSAADAGKTFLIGACAANTNIYCPTGLPVGFQCDVIRRAAASQRIRIFESGTTIESKTATNPELANSGNGGEKATILQITTNIYAVYGDI